MLQGKELELEHTLYSSAGLLYLAEDHQLAMDRRTSSLTLVLKATKARSILWDPTSIYPSVQHTMTLQLSHWARMLPTRSVLAYLKHHYHLRHLMIIQIPTAQHQMYRTDTITVTPRRHQLIRGQVELHHSTSLLVQITTSPPTQEAQSYPLPSTIHRLLAPRHLQVNHVPMAEPLRLITI
jgi:hypothetical protein